jgi:signal transduction histidine kinase
LEHPTAKPVAEMNRDQPPHSPHHAREGHPPAYQELRRIHQMNMQSLLSLCDMIYWEYDISADRLFLNRFATEDTGGTGTDPSLTREEAISFIHPDDRSRVATETNKLITGEITHLEAELRTVKNGNPEKWFRVRGMLINMDPERTALSLGGFAQDISLQKQLQIQLSAARKHAEESDHLKTAFLTNMSHEIRTPMNAIIGFSELMSDPSISREDIAVYAGIIKTRSTHLLQIVSDILDISRIESNTVEFKETAFALNPLLDDIYMVYAQRLIDDKKKSISLRVEKALHDASFLILSDELRLRQILGNLLDNALKFTHTGTVSFGYRLSNGELVFFVKDTGVGIPADKHNLIFERFRQADVTLVRQFGGNGLGLSICKALVEMMGGRIWVESASGAGSEFFFTLPQSRVAITDAPEATRFTGIPVLDWKGKRILLVEDDPVSAGLLQEILSRTGVGITVVTTANEAIKVFKKNMFDLVLMDVLLPDMSGLEVTRILKEKQQNLPVIAQTAYAMPGHGLQCLQAGCDEYITKPVNISELFSAVNRYLR